MHLSEVGHGKSDECHASESMLHSYTQSTIHMKLPCIYKGQAKTTCAIFVNLFSHILQHRCVMTNHLDHQEILITLFVIIEQCKNVFIYCQYSKICPI